MMGKRKMRKSRRGQIALEQVFTYGLVMMTVMALGGVLFVYGRNTSKNVFPPQCEFLSGLDCMDSTIVGVDNASSNSTILIHLKNDLGFDIFNISMWMNGTCDSPANVTGVDSLLSLQSATYSFGCQNLQNREIVEVITIMFNSLQTGNTHRKTGSLRYEP